MNLGKDEKEGLPVLLPFVKVCTRHESARERERLPSHPDGHLFKWVHRTATCHGQLNSWPVENYLGLYVLGELRWKRTWKQREELYICCLKHFKKVKIPVLLGEYLAAWTFGG